MEALNLVQEKRAWAVVCLCMLQCQRLLRKLKLILKKFKKKKKGRRKKKTLQPYSRKENYSKVEIKQDYRPNLSSFGHLFTSSLAAQMHKRKCECACVWGGSEEWRMGEKITLPHCLQPARQGLVAVVALRVTYH